MNSKFTIAIDFDGTVVEHKYPDVGTDVFGAVAVMREIIEAGHDIILWTMRDKKELEDAIAWFATKKIPLRGINNNPEQVTWTSSPKCFAHLYIDDAALGCPLYKPLQDLPYVDWVRVRELLKTNNIIK